MNGAPSFHTDGGSSVQQDGAICASTSPLLRLGPLVSSSYPGASQNLVAHSDPQSTSQASSPGMVDFSKSQFGKLKKNIIIPAAKWAYSPLSHKNKNSEEPSVYRIEYSVFKKLKYLKSIENEYDLGLHFDHTCFDDDGGAVSPGKIVNHQDFEAIIGNVSDMIENQNIHPERISQGSSGSYFLHYFSDNEAELAKVGVFKPKDEEPYGPLSPKWTKWLHRTFLPCFFGRSCLIPNLGYISEVAACVLDQQLHSFIVPRTEIVYLRSPKFYYSYWEKSSDITQLPRKIGSLQMFLDGYIEASTWIKMFPFPPDMDIVPDYSDIMVSSTHDSLDSIFKWSKTTLQQFREELEKLVILDYIMRNTDRASDNWMIKIHWVNKLTENGQSKFSPVIKIGAIDSGLAFPWKRPDQWRSFPFGWLFLPVSIIGQPFSIKTKQHFLPLLTSTFWWEETVAKLREIFEVDVDFKERMWLKQLAVLKGQAFNVVEALKSRHSSPLDLARRDNILIWDDFMYIPESVNSNILADAIETNIDVMKTNMSDPFIENSMVRQNETSSLLNSTQNSYNNISNFNPTPSTEHEMSGFLYNLNQEINEDTRDEPYLHTNTRKVIVERLEKVNSKPPVFTWC